MRSKEVEEAIKTIQEQKENVECGINDMECMPECYDENIYNDYIELKKKAETVLSYIEELEKENKYLRDENNIYKNETVSKNKIRDKIELLKDIEQEFTDEQGYWGGQALLDKIEFLEDLLGE